MKKLMLLCMLCIGCLAMQAQDKQKHKEKMSKDCVMMEDGKMMSMMGGKTMIMDKDMTMKNGTMVMTDGTVKIMDMKGMKHKNKMKNKS